MNGQEQKQIRASRRALLVGGLAAAGGAAVAAGSALSQTVPAPETHAGHDMSTMAHGSMTTVGRVDHATNGFDPTAMLTDWYTGTVSQLPDGRVLRTFEIETIDKEVEIAPGIFFPATG